MALSLFELEDGSLEKTMETLTLKGGFIASWV